jgi:hypothetical protein
MAGSPSPNYHNLKIGFGRDVHVFEDNDPTNTKTTRIMGAITLNAMGNTQGGYFVMLLTTGRRILRQQWTSLPMPEGQTTFYQENRVQSNLRGTGGSYVGRILGTSTSGIQGQAQERRFHS